MRPRTKVISKFPKIWDDIIIIQNKPNSSVFLSSPATVLTYDPCATQIAEAEAPQVAAPKRTRNHPNPTEISYQSTMISPAREYRA